MIIGGHSHQKIDTIVNNIPIFQAGSYLQYLGKIEMTVKNKSITDINYKLINLKNISEYDQEMKAVIDEYNGLPGLDDVIGNSLIHHERFKVGCFYVDALKNTMNVDVSFQNLGGVRYWLDKGDITKREIYTVAPFNNQTIVYDMSVQQIKDFLIGTQSGFFFSGIQIQQIGNHVEIRDEQGNLLEDNITLSIGLNDYIPAVYDMYFPKNGSSQNITAAETIMHYLQNINSQVNYPSCGNYFKFRP